MKFFYLFDDPPLYLAVLVNKIEFVKLLLARKDIDVNAKTISKISFFLIGFQIELLIQFQFIYIDRVKKTYLLFYSLLKFL